MESVVVDVALSRDLSDRVAIVGVGETDYRSDYVRARAAEKLARAARAENPEKTPAEASQNSVSEYDESPYAFAVSAFRAALEDAGLSKEDVDGLAVSVGSAYPLNYERVGEMLGLTVTWGAETGTPDHLVQSAVQGISSGLCNTVAIIYGNASRVRGVTAYGGGHAPRDGYMNQWYYHVFGFSSPGAQFSLAFQQYVDRFGKDPDLLAAVPLSERQNALLNPRAVMQTPLTRQEYLASRYISRPFRVLDYCMVNDGGACLILRRADRADNHRHVPVLVSGIGRLGSYKRHTQMGFRLIDETWTNVRGACDQARTMAGLEVGDIDIVQCYDGFSFQVPTFLEGCGFCKPGEGLDFVQDGRIAVDGELPTNTSGGMLSESYMHGMNLHVEAVRQLRGQAGQRQVDSAGTAIYCHHGHWGALAMIYRRGD